MDVLGDYPLLKSIALKRNNGVLALSILGHLCQVLEYSIEISKNVKNFSFLE
jgi:hypothetical protein